MKFNDTAKRNLFRFIDGIRSERSICDIKSYISALKDYGNFDEYFDNIVEPIFPEAVEKESKMKNYRIQTDLAIVAGLYYGDDLSIKHLERDYKPDLSREQLRQEVITFTSHILFGRDASGVEQVGDLRVEKEGLVPIMNRVLASSISEQEQKNELMGHLRVYGILSERAMQEAREAADKDPDVILARNTYQNRMAALTATSFVEMVGGKRPDVGKGVTFTV